MRASSPNLSTYPWLCAALTSLSLVACGDAFTSAQAGGGGDGGAASTGGSGGAVTAGGGVGGQPASCDTPVPAIPSMWQGPVVTAKRTVAEDLPSCGDNAGTYGSDLGSDQEVCECSCTKDRTQCEAIVTGVLNTCGPGSASQTLPHGCTENLNDVIVPGMGNKFARYYDNETPSAVCQLNYESEIPPATWGQHWRTCALPTTTVAGTLCADAAPVGYGAATCIYREGDRSCSNLGAYTDKQIVYQDFDDDRHCEENCSCGTDNAHCGGTVEFFGAQMCDNSLGLLGVPGPTCVLVGQAESVRYNAMVSGSCSQQGQSFLDGLMTPTKPVTLCCTAAPG